MWNVVYKSPNNSPEKMDNKSITSVKKSTPSPRRETVPIEVNNSSSYEGENEDEFADSDVEQIFAPRGVSSFVAEA